ncbi:MAG TPA: bifunctional glutamate N-acetyltransferase/amino-acid acetyltransferase ArgJ [Tepidisphaeraceae bacterium]|nr:bifunctional glutamate N-acetyltransferase/amino-acid acetyltransferase ArgJ [Tepidisphaeraceae bacterium]
MGQLHLLSPLGFRAAGIYAGIKSRHLPDIGLLVCQTRATAAAVFTTNKVFAAPVKVGREHIADGRLRAVVVNSGNANACTGRQGEKDAHRMCEIAADAVGCLRGEVLPSSTGVIGHHLPMEKVGRGIAEAAQYLGDSLEHALLFSDAILTTDTKRKTAAAQFKVGREKVTLAGVCKGSGMIGPRMVLPAATKGGRKSKKPLHATMLAYLTTDAKVPAAMLRKFMGAACDASFNAVTIDDHMSTNDTAALLASGLGAAIDSTKARDSFARALDEVCQSLAYQIAADGEGATKVVVVRVKGAASDAAAKAMARAIANSPLVKCAMHGNDPNWGRIVSAAGLANVPFDPNRSSLNLQRTVVFRNGQPVEFDRAKVSESLNSPQVQVELSCGMSCHQATVWTCDLSKDYVTINADYHT